MHVLQGRGERGRAGAGWEKTADEHGHWQPSRKRGRGIPSVEDRIKCGKEKTNGIDLDIDMRDKRREKTTDLVKGSVGCQPI
jgi:hypothetical protein